MRRLVATILFALAGVGSTAAQGDDWAATWDGLAALEALDSASAEAAPLAGELATVAADADDASRALLLRARLARYAGRDATGLGAQLERTPITDFAPRECWLLATTVASLPVRTRAVLRALDGTPELSREQLLLSWNVAVENARALRLADGAGPIQRILHARYAAEWSATDLALTLSRLGDAEGVAAVFGAMIEREQGAGRPTADLWSRWGIAELGFGDESRARDYLGQALARGSNDAALVLGRLELDAGRTQAARRSFRPSILSDAPAAWAARGWGLTLLPRARTASALPPATPSDPTLER